MSELKRYDLMSDGFYSNPGVWMDEAKDGEWCRYEDVVARFDFYRDRFREHRAAYDELVGQLEEIKSLLQKLATISRSLGNEELARQIEQVVQR